MPDGREVYQQYLIDEFLDDYRDRKVSRRQTLKLLAGITGSMSAAGFLVAACSPAPAPAPTAAPTAAPAATATARPANTPVPDDRRVAATDPAVRAEVVKFASGSDQIMGYMARPAAGSGPFPAVMVCHENRGVTDHIQDVARRFAKSGYVGFAVDLLSREGGTDKIDPSAIPGLLTNVPPDRHAGDFVAAMAYLNAQSVVAKGRVGMTGFCFGGGMTWLTASKAPDLKVAVPFYGPAPADPKVLSNVKAAVLGVYAGLDERVNASIPAVEAALKDSKVTFELKKYENSNHGFHNDTGGVYNPTTARQAWADALALFDKTLKA